MMFTINAIKNSTTIKYLNIDTTIINNKYCSELYNRVPYNKYCSELYNHVPYNKKWCYDIINY